MVQTKTKKKKLPILQTPVGTALFPYLNKPAPPYADKPGEPPVWKVTIKLKNSDPEVRAFIADLQARYDANLAEAELEEEPKARAERLKSKNPNLGADTSWKAELDEQGNETGYTLLTLKQKSWVVRKSDGEKFEFFVDLFDAKGSRIERNAVKIGGGSTVTAAFEVDGFFSKLGAGLSLRLKAVQVLEVVEWQGRDASGYGFKVRDGFSAEEAANTDAGDEVTASPSGADDSI